MLAETPVTSKALAISASMTNPLHYYSNYFATPTTSLRINTSLVSLGQTLYQDAPRETNTHCCSALLHNRNSDKPSALRKLNNQQRQVSMFLIPLFKFSSQFPFVSFISISILSLLPFSILSLLPLLIFPRLSTIPSFS